MRVYCLLLGYLLGLTPGLLAQNAELKALAEEDQAVQHGKAVARTDGDRGKLVLELLAKGAAQTPQDKFNAALVLQHTELHYCNGRLASNSPDNYLLAHYLAKEAYAAGYEDARTLVAQTIDRFLSFTEGRQLYGTNRITNQKIGKEELVPIDRSVPDSERAKYGVRPLAELLKAYPEQQPENKTATPKNPGTSK